MGLMKNGMTRQVAIVHGYATRSRAVALSVVGHLATVTCRAGRPVSALGRAAPRASPFLAPSRLPGARKDISQQNRIPNIASFDTQFSTDQKYEALAQTLNITRLQRSSPKTVCRLYYPIDLTPDGRRPRGSARNYRSTALIREQPVPSALRCSRNIIRYPKRICFTCNGLFRSSALQKPGRPAS